MVCEYEAERDAKRAAESDSVDECTEEGRPESAEKSDDCELSAPVSDNGCMCCDGCPLAALALEMERARKRRGERLGAGGAAKPAVAVVDEASAPATEPEPEPEPERSRADGGSGGKYLDCDTERVGCDCEHSWSCDDS